MDDFWKWSVPFAVFLCLSAVQALRKHWMNALASVLAAGIGLLMLAYMGETRRSAGLRERLRSCEGDADEMQYIPVRMPDSQLVKAICPNGYTNGLYELSPPWVGQVETNVTFGTIDHVALVSDTTRLFDRIMISTNFRSIYIGTARSNNCWSSLHEYRDQLPNLADIASSRTVSQIESVLGNSLPGDGYGANWSLFTMDSSNRMMFLEVSAFWMCGERLVRTLEITQGSASPKR